MRSPHAVNAMDQAVRMRLAPVGKRVAAIANHDSFSIAPEIESNHTTGGFLRTKLGHALEQRGVAPCLLEGYGAANTGLTAAPTRPGRQCLRRNHRFQPCRNICGSSRIH